MLVSRSEGGGLKGEDHNQLEALAQGAAAFQGAGEAFARLAGLVRYLRSPRGCPWDQEQTHRSLRPYVLEEAYEVIEAIDSLAAGDPAGGNKLQEELGDLLLQVLLHAEIASEQQLFDAASLMTALYTKLIRRHPHVFGNEEAATVAAVGQVWEAVKAQERQAAAGQSGQAVADEAGQAVEGGGGRPQGVPSHLDRVSGGLPAMVRSFQLQKEAAKAGFDWERPEAALKKVWEEAREVRAAWQAGQQEELEAEIGDLFFALINVSRLLRVNPEIALAGAARRFEDRFRRMEAAAARSGHLFEQLDLERQEALWQAAKEEINREQREKRQR